MTREPHEERKAEADRVDPREHIAPLPRISIQIFCESPDVAELVNEAMTDRRMSRAHVKVHMGGALAAVEAYRTAPTPKPRRHRERRRAERNSSRISIRSPNRAIPAPRSW